MNYIEFLGTSGSKAASQATMCLKVSKHCVIDAGNIIAGCGTHLYDIEHIFLTHAHLDHIIDIPFLADLFVIKKKVPLKIYGLKETLDHLRQFIFNHHIWPNFEEINLLQSDSSTVKFIEIFPNQTYEIDGITLTPFKTNHTNGSCGYLIEQNNHGVLFTSDTYKCQEIWDMLDANPQVHSLIVDISFPSSYDEIARNSKHMTPKILAEELLLCKRNDFRVFPIHLKPSLESTIKHELKEMGIFERGGHVLEGFERLAYNPATNTAMFFKHSSHSITSQIIAIGTALTAEKNIDKLLEMIISQTKLLTHADAGTLYLYNSKKKQLEFKVVQNDSLGIQKTILSESPDWKTLPLFDDNGQENRSLVSAVCALEKRTISIDDVYESKEYDFAGTVLFDKEKQYRSKSMLVLPLMDHDDNLIGVLQLINKVEGDGTVIPFTFDDEEIATSLGSQAAVALIKQRLINDLESLLESFLNTINVAIEEKSPYTAGHIDKMVDLSLVLAREISNDEEYFPEISYNEDQLKEIKFAALMHDIGKITTPEHIIDKTTKLETIYDRIEMIELKYEILKRDAYAEFMIEKNNAFDNDTLEKYEESYQNRLKQLDDEILFLQTANIGSEFFSNEDIERIHQIAQRTVEISGKKQYILSEDEIANLCVQKGTLTYDQRMIINNHAHVSLRMLQQLPFPHKLERVAEIACGHHEKVNGGGYPLGLKGDELSFEARILAIADIFEALTASDRPYKKAKKLSEAMKILFFMVKDGHIDTDITRFFYESGLYLRFAQRVLLPENIDEVNLNFESIING